MLEASKIQTEYMARRLPRTHRSKETQAGEREGVVNELHKPARRNYPKRHVIINGLYDLYQADLVEMIPYADENQGFKYLMSMIDTFSKRGWLFPLKSKTGKEIASVVNTFLKSLKKTPKLLQVDQGSEFFNKNVMKVLKEYGVKLYHSYSPLKASIVERFNRTIKTWMWKHFTLQGNHEWISLFKDLLHKYNTRIHRTIGVAPLSVNETNEEAVLKRLNKNLRLPPKQTPKFKVGQSVRISKFKHVFEKGYTPNWTTEVFTIREVGRTRPVTYKLRDWENEDIIGGFYEEELQKTKYPDTYLVEEELKHKGNRVYVKWLGFDKKYNQWIDANNLRE